VFRKTTDDSTANQLLGALQKQAAVDLIVLPISQSDEHVYTREAPSRCPRRPTARVGNSGCSASAMADARELSGVRTGEFVAGERITLTDHKGRRHSIVLAGGPSSTPPRARSPTTT
jgi:hypothetical protein